MERDILLIVTGGLIGLVSSLATVFAIYWLDGVRLRRQWEREDQLALRQKREELHTLLAAAEPSGPAPDEELPGQGKKPGF